MAIARTLLKQPCVLLYDKVTTSLDSTRERLSTVAIMVMDQGEVVEKESHQLVVKGGELVGFNMVVEDS